MAGSIEFTPPYQDGWQDNEEGATPITADILNNNYDAFLTLLNAWIGSVEGTLVDIPVNITAQTQQALDGLYGNLLIQNPTSGQVLKFNGSKWVNATESGGGSNVSWNQILQSGTLIATVTINGASYNVYAPSGSSSVASLDDLTDVDLNNLSNGQILQYNASTSKWENVSAGGGGYEPTGEVYTFFTEGSRASANLVLYVSWTDGESVVTAEVVTFSEIASGWLTEDYRNITINWDRNTGSFNFVAKSGSFEYNGSYFDEGDTIGSLETGTVTFNAVEKEATNVSWTQVQASGTKIAEISIDGVSQNIYIPNLPTKTSDLTNDSNFVADASYVHTDNNYTATEKNKLSGLVAVEANPSGTASTDLTKIAIGGTNYNIPSGGGGGSSTFAGLSDVDIDDTTLANGQVPIWDETEEKWKNGNGGGGTTVIANPTGTPTDDLNSIQIGSDIYRIVGGGGGTAKALVMKTMTWTGDGQSSKSITFDKKPLAIFNIWGRGEGSSNVYCLNAPFVYGETNYFISSYSGGIIIPSVTYSNDGLTMTMSGADAGFAFNCANAPYTMWYLVEENVGGSASCKDITGTLTAGQTEITLADPIITTASTLEPFTDKFGVNPTNMELIPGAESVLQPLVESESELLGTVTVSSTFASYAPWKAFTSAGSWVAEGNIDQWFAYEFPTNVIVSKIQWICDDTSRRSVVTNIQYSNDGTTWNDCTLLKNETGDVEISGANSAKHWRLFFAEPFGSWTEPMIRNLEFIAVVNGVKLTFPVQSENLNVKVRVS